jgi:DNA polymerase-3 subunit alpha
MTLQTEKSRSAILTAGRSLGIDNDVTAYIASLVVFDRGQPRTLHTMYYGNEDYPPVYEFKREMDEHLQLWETAQKIEGLISGVGSHAGGVIICDKPLTESTALMRTNSGDIITQFDLHGDEDVSLIKIDLLATDVGDLTHVTLDLLLKDNVIQWQGSLKATYEKYVGIYNIDRDAPEMWDMISNHKVINLFQMEKDSGKRALALVKPKSVDDLATINSVIRLMPQTKGAETPLEKYARFHDNIQLWYDEMTEYGLTEEEQNILKEIVGISCGICEAQEYLVLLTMNPKIGGFSLAWADRLRKAVAKKSPKDFEQLEKEFFKNAKEKNLSEKLCNYVWYVLIYTQRGYGFNKSHTLGYSHIGVQEAYLNYKYNPIYWQTANLIVQSGAYNADANDSTDYDKIGVAIATIQMEGVKVEPPLINDSQFGFIPDVKNNQIIFGLKGVNGVNTDIAQAIIQNRPYTSIEDFATRMIDTNIIKNNQMIKLIKGGCFTAIHSSNKRETMKWYLSKYCVSPVSNLGLSQLKRMIEYNIIPNELALAVKMVNFKKYVLDDEGLYEKWIDTSKSRIPKRGYHDGHYILDEPSQEFFKQHFTEESIVDVVGGFYVLSEKKFIKEIDKKIEPLREWFNSEEAIQVYNQTLFNEVWDKYADGTSEAWSMEALTYYDGDHELKNVPENLYGIVNFFELPEEPVAYEFYTRYIDGKPKAIPKYNISRIAGTVVQTDNNHHSIALVTTHGLVNIKFSKGHYAFYNKRISQIGENGKKTTIEDSWLKRGNKLLVSGYRRGEQFIPWIYNDTIYRHRINLIENVNEDGTLKLKAERAKV